jgi:hypothetical protein
MARHDPNRRPGKQGPDRRRPGRRDPWLPAFFVAPLVVLGLASAADMMRREAARPAIGDMVVFPGQTQRVMVRVAAPVVTLTGQRCVLDSQIMANRGGSLLVHRRLPHDPPSFHARWIGGVTAESALDCGQDVTVEIGRVELRKLATAMGGFHTPRGSGPRREPARW